MFNVTLPAMIRGRLAFLVMLLVLPHVAAQAAETVPSAKTDLSLKSDLSPKSDLSLKRDLPKTTGKTSALFPMADLPEVDATISEVGHAGSAQARLFPVTLELP